MKTKNTNKEEIKQLQMCIVDMHKRIKELEKNSHPPVFKKNTYEEINSRLLKLEAFIDNIYQITTIINDEENNNGMAN